MVVLVFVSFAERRTQARLTPREDPAARIGKGIQESTALSNRGRTNAF
jgi:hypothetical protein